MGDDTNFADIIETLNEILAHRIFAASPKAQDFLRYIITESLAGRDEKLTGVSIAQDVFQKDSDFDSIQDSVVRVTARRVRYMLQDYYSQCTSEPKVKISIPKGKYRPHFEFAEKQPVQETPTPSPAVIETTEIVVRPKRFKLFGMAGLLTAILCVAILGFVLPKMNANSAIRNNEIASYPSIAIISFTNQTDDEAYGFLEQSLQKQMTEDLSRFTLIRPLSYDKAYETLLMEGQPLYDYAITGVILGVEPEIDLYIKLIDLNNMDVIFEDRIRRAPGQTQYYDALFDMVSDLSGNFAGMEGVIVQERLGAIQDKIASDTKALTDLNALECNSLIDKLLEKPSPELYKTIYNCLEMLLEKDPEDDTSLASFGWLNYVGATSHEPVLMARSINPDINTDMGFALIEKAIKINPQNSWAQQTLSSLKLYVGDIQDALKHAELAVLENPANPDNLTWLGLCLAHNGNWARAVRLTQEAMDRNPDPPVTYYYTFFLKALRDDDAVSMTEIAATFTKKENYYAKLYSYLAAVAAGDKDMAKMLKPYINELAKRNDGDIMSVIRSRMPSRDLQQKAQHLIIKGENLLSETDG